MSDLIKRIVQFNYDAGLVETGYDDLRECSFQIEEALEGFSGIHLINPETTTSSPKGVSRDIVSNAGDFLGGDVDRLDKACDAAIFAIGSMAKLRLSSDQMIQALNIVMEANETKVNCKKDALGKIGKPDNFVNPEPLLQELLNQRG